MEGADSVDALLLANEAFYRAFNDKDGDGMERAWSAREDVGCIHPGWNLLRGRDAVIGSWRSILSNPAQARVVIGGAEATLLGEVGFVVCREFVAGSPLVATNVFVIEAGAWKLLHHQSGPVAGAG